MENNIVWHSGRISREQRSAIKVQNPCLLWFTGLSGSGKSTIANAVDEFLHKEGYHTYVLDGDNIRHRLNRDLGFSDADRVENIRRIGEVSHLFVDAGLIVLSASISPFTADRDMVRKMVGENEFIEIYVNTPMETCERRDPKGLYRKVRAGKINSFTGINSSYEPPSQPNIKINTKEMSVLQCVRNVVAYLEENGMIHKSPTTAKIT